MKVFGAGVAGPCLLALFGPTHATSPDAVGTGDELWAVITTILDVSPSVKDFVVNVKGSRLVVAGDHKTNHSNWDDFASEHSNVVYLSPTNQDELGFSILDHIPWNHFGRKSIGFMYAAQQGAKRIYDFDDDNHMTIPTFENLPNMDLVAVQTDHHIYNPYPHFQPMHSKDGQDPAEAFTWPRGQALQFINDVTTYDVPHLRSVVKYEDIAVVQSLVQNDPDVDAIYRLTRPLPVDFLREQQEITLPPRRTFVPWNAQATLVSKVAFFGLLLPVTVTGRVSDIWRSYITQRLMWETNYHLGFSSPFVTQFRNPHSYLKDFEDEADLYSGTDHILKTLAEWTSTGFDTLDAAYVDLVGKLVAECPRS